MDKNILLAKKSLENNGFTVEVFNNCEEAKEFLADEIKIDETVGLGGSITLYNMDLYEELKKRGNKVYWHWMADNKEEELINASLTDVYLSSTNAITLDGKLVNMDGAGNRVASLIYGHRRVYIIAGKNKIAKDYYKARERIKTIAAPKNAHRLNTNTPCKKTGECSDCNSLDRICKIEVIIHKNPAGADINILLINEDLGY